MSVEVRSSSLSRWPNDKYNERRNRSYVSPLRERDRDRNDEFMVKRRKQRERISLTGVPEIWGNSPARIDE